MIIRPVLTQDAYNEIQKWMYFTIGILSLFVFVMAIGLLDVKIRLSKGQLLSDVVIELTLIGIGIGIYVFVVSLITNYLYEFRNISIIKKRFNKALKTSKALPTIRDMSVEMDDSNKTIVVIELLENYFHSSYELLVDGEIVKLFIHQNIMDIGDKSIKSRFENASQLSDEIITELKLLDKFKKEQHNNLFKYLKDIIPEL